MSYSDPRGWLRAQRPGRDEDTAIVGAICAAGSGMFEMCKVLGRPGPMQAIGPTALVLLLVAACTPDDGGDGAAEPESGPDAVAGLADVDLSEHELVYTRFAGDEEADLWLAKADGTDPVRLTVEPGLEFMAAWSPDGDRLAYAAGATQDSQSDLFVLDLDSGELEQVSSTPDRCESAPSWAPDGEELVYVSRDCDEEGEGIFASGLDGEDERELVATGSWPDVGPDGRLLYTAPVTGQPWHVQRLWVSEPDGSAPREVTPEGFTSASEATWSPDGSRIPVLGFLGVGVTGRDHEGGTRRST